MSTIDEMTGRFARTPSLLVLDLVTAVDVWYIFSPNFTADASTLGNTETLAFLQACFIKAVDSRRGGFAKGLAGALTGSVNMTRKLDAFCKRLAALGMLQNANVTISGDEVFKIKSGYRNSFQAISQGVGTGMSTNVFLH